MTVMVDVQPSASNARVQEMLGGKALAAFARSLGQPRLIIQSDGENSIVELVRQTCDELPRARHQKDQWQGGNEQTELSRA